MSFDSSGSSVSNKELVVQYLSELTSGGTLLKAGRSVSYPGLVIIKITCAYACRLYRFPQKSERLNFSLTDGYV